MKNPTKKGYFLTKTIEQKWGVAYWDGKQFWDDRNQDGRFKFGNKARIYR